MSLVFFPHQLSEVNTAKCNGHALLADSLRIYCVNSGHDGRKGYWLVC